MITENERSIAIDIITDINLYINEYPLMIKHAGGESSLKNKKDNNTLFPDTIIYADKSKTEILHGWELKLPETDINNQYLIENAQKKANLLGVNSFLVWNLSIAKLYRIDSYNNIECIKTWDNLSHIRTKQELDYTDVKKMLIEILNDLNNFFVNGEILKGKTIETLSNEFFLDLIFQNSKETVSNFEMQYTTDFNFKDEINLWWNSESSSFDKKTNKFQELSKIVILSLINKILFANILSKYKKEAKKIKELSTTTSPYEGLQIFNEISKKCDFYNIFEEKMGEQYVDLNSWNILKEFNDFLLELNIKGFDDKVLHELLYKVVTRSKRKMMGQFSTPKELAYLLSNLTLTNFKGTTFDPCCGTGTIAKSAYSLKIHNHVKEIDAIDAVWASDKFRYPLQIAMLALTTPTNVGKQIKVFKKDVFELDDKLEISLHDSKDGHEIKTSLPKFNSIISNLPFVQQESLEKFNPKAINCNLNGKSDLYAYIPFKLSGFLEENGHLGVIISNSWLGTEWGGVFFEELLKFYEIKHILTSGNGRWFSNADVVTNILICKKRKSVSRKDEKISFIVFKEKLKDLFLNEDSSINYDKLDIITASIRSQTHSVDLIQNLYTLEEINKITDMGLSKSSLFADCSWILKLNSKLISANSLFHINRGERRGWNELFYPKKGHSIEKQYISPCLKNLKKSEYISGGSVDAFCCNVGKKDLQKLGHTEAIKWIKKFESIKNGKGNNLPIVLSKPNMLWYEMSSDKKCDIGITMNPDERIFFSRFKEKTFVDQRIIGFTLKTDEDPVLLTALLNSILGLFYVEALGFGKGLGALDLSSQKIKIGFKMLNPKLISESSKNNIKTLYSKLEQRKVLPLENELEAIDRVALDKFILNEYGILPFYDKIKASLLDLYKIRKAINK